VLADAVSQLRSRLEDTHGIRVTEAVFTASHLLALYQDDLEDAADQLGIRYVTPKRQIRPFVWESAATYAGYGMGLCEHWEDDELCAKEERQMSIIPALSVHYTSVALTVALPRISFAVGAFEPEHAHVEHFTLGHDAIVGYPSTVEYWADVKSALVYLIDQLGQQPQRIIVSGDRADTFFLGFVGATMRDHLGSTPTIYADLTEVVAARGAAELMRRGAAPWSKGPKL
jgi:hypothetical protein